MIQKGRVVPRLSSAHGLDQGCCLLLSAHWLMDRPAPQWPACKQDKHGICLELSGQHPLFVTGRLSINRKTIFIRTWLLVQLSNPSLIPSCASRCLIDKPRGLGISVPWREHAFTKLAIPSRTAKSNDAIADAKHATTACSPARTEHGTLVRLPVHLINLINHMPPQSRGSHVPPGFQSKSTPNLPTLHSVEAARRQREHHDAGYIAPEPPSARGPELGPRSPVPNSALSGAASAEDSQEEDQDTLAIDESESESEEGEETSPPTSRPLYTSRSHTHLPQHTATALFPPFYNRPPTPLPPSPSLTSLLRPPFASSRPTTPESSDVESPAQAGQRAHGSSTPGANAANLVNSARLAPTVPRASPKVPTYEYYGFALYLGSSAAFLMYILWAYVPAPLLHQMGIHYYPNRWWALAVPCWLVVLVIYIYVALASYNTRYLTLPLSSCENLVDECAQIAVVDRTTGQIVRDPVLVTDKLHDKDKEKASSALHRSDSFSRYRFEASDDVDWKGFWSTGTDAVMDVPIGGVCEILYASED
ncbi:hypothetical protein LEMA_P021890.1 [Plenodomus lingam JN3]|uniref:PIG-P domain-containing protein n=1 Tax=Leptosphaeria maculans (strain JN3 / isolate v23.1.3 / race Av1-4-5-6-7-8) TaxID=985895 RepID=E5ABL8_LEPMJ|nr:hypothetical protein LEMA_P021890.1 [Plenodomus lingam JN3]CBY01059.1 hypothetical protein LEMA_P021890.1 [Plenodomus lingam JN3]